MLDRVWLRLGPRGPQGPEQTDGKEDGAGHRGRGAASGGLNTAELLIDTRDKILLKPSWQPDRRNDPAKRSAVPTRPDRLHPQQQDSSVSITDICFYPLYLVMPSFTARFLLLAQSSDRVQLRLTETIKSFSNAVGAHWGETGKILTLIRDSKQQKLRIKVIKGQETSECCTEHLMGSSVSLRRTSGSD